MTDDGITLPNQESWNSVASILGIKEEEFPSLASVLMPGTATALSPILQTIVMCLEDVISLFDTPVFDLKTLVELLLFC